MKDISNPILAEYALYLEEVVICIRDLKFMCIDLYNGDCPGNGHLEISTS